ncbi:hypothetical protein [Alicyclobacillus contaminans]|uniref:hypothetical protein n=1 Tax=Alicyclobacillus contaminans TaxID=392016 RepID=UPI0004298246|nr:hypothetical protein [Alicyclobacillus contaminans]
MASYATPSDLNTYTGQTVDPALAQLLLDTATQAVDSYCNRTFQLTSTTELYYGNNSNTLMLRNYPVLKLTTVRIVMPGELQFNIPVSQLLVQPEIGKVVNYTPLMFQTLGYAAVFPDSIPIRVEYTYGPRAMVSGDSGTADSQYKTYTFSNKNWFQTAPVNVYKNGQLLKPGVDYTADYDNGTITLTNAVAESDVITADYWYYQVPSDIKLATLMLATKQLNLPKNNKLMMASRGDSDFKVQYGVVDALAAMDQQVSSLLASYKRKGVW